MPLGIARKQWTNVTYASPRCLDTILLPVGTEGKTASDLRGYSEKLSEVVRWVQDATLYDLSMELAKEHILTTASPKSEPLSKGPVTLVDGEIQRLFTGLYQNNLPCCRDAALRLPF